jgi:SAM-dependent methyltransferase
LAFGFALKTGGRQGERQKMNSTAQEGLRAEDWAGEMGRNWLANLAKFEGMIQPMGAALIKHAGFKPGEHVVDIGCGGGATTIAIARAVSPGGSATGLDISQELIDSCTVRGAKGTQSALYWVCADAATTVPTNAPFDRLVSRFGSMFFPDARAGFRNLRRMIRSGGRLNVAVWGPPMDNAWIRTINGVGARHLPEAPPPDPHAPGPFAFSDTGYFGEVLEQAGFGRIEIVPFEAKLAIGGPGASAREAAEFVVAATHMGKALASVGPEKLDAAVADLAEAFAPHHLPGKGTLLGGKAWLVTAQAI